MALATLNVQQNSQPDRKVILRRLPGDRRFGLSVKTAEGEIDRQPFVIKRVTNPDLLRKLGVELRQRPTRFSITVDSKTYAVQSAPIPGTDHIRLHLSSDATVIVEPGDSDEPAAMVGAAAVVIFAVAAVVVAATVVDLAVTVTSEDGSGDIEGDSGDDEEGGSDEK